jgi:hypothetical protein
LQSRGAGKNWVRACCSYVVRMFSIVDIPQTSAVFISSNFVRGVYVPECFSLLKKVPVVFLIYFEEFDTVPLVFLVVFDVVFFVRTFSIKNDSS